MGTKDVNNPVEVSLINNPVFQKINIKINTTIPAAFTIHLFDLQGRYVDQLFSGMIAGTQLVSCETEKLNTGVYFIRIQSNAVDKTIKVCYVK